MTNKTLKHLQLAQTEPTTKTKTLQPVDTPLTHAMQGVAAAGLGVSLLLIVTAIGGIFYKLWSNKKGRAFLKQTYNDLKDELDKLERKYLSDKTDLIYNPSINAQDKQKELETLKTKYNEDYTRLSTKLDDVKMKMKGKL